MRRLNLKRASSGFTLIELIITIVIIGVLAAVAIPKFQSLTGDAEKGAGDGVAAALASATSVNYAKSKLSTAVACSGTLVYGTTCSYYALPDCTALAAAASNLADMAGWTVDTASSTGGGTLTPGVANTNCKIKSSSTTATVVAVNAYGA